MIAVARPSLGLDPRVRPESSAPGPAPSPGSAAPDGAAWARFAAGGAQLKAKIERDNVMEQLTTQVKNVPAPTPEQLQKYYDDHKDKFTSPEQVHIRLILLKVDPSAPQAQWAGAKEEGAAISKRLRAGAGRPGKDLLWPSGPHEILVRGNRRTGKLELVLDGVVLEETAGLKAPDADRLEIVIRSWEPVRVVSAELEAGR